LNGSFRKNKPTPQPGSAPTTLVHVIFVFAIVVFANVVFAIVE
jgi:hypothetical protein